MEGPAIYPDSIIGKFYEFHPHLIRSRNTTPLETPQMQSLSTSNDFTPQSSLVKHPTRSRPRVAMIVADPKDEVIWGGGLLLSNPNWQWSIISACCNADSEQKLNFPSILDQLNAMGAVIDLNVGPDQKTVSEIELDLTIESHLSHHYWDLIVTHGPIAEYASHRRSREVCDSVVRLWEKGRIRNRELWMFAYDDENGSCLPRAQKDASIVGELEYSTWEKKFRLITETYGFPPASWEVRVAPCTEGFNAFKTPKSAREYIDNSHRY